MASFVEGCLPASVQAQVDLKRAYNAESLFNGVPALNCNVVAINSKWIAYPDKEGYCLTILDHISPARRSYSPQKREPWHQGQGIKDFAFNPFDPNQVITVASDGWMKLWNIPEGGCVANELSNPIGKWKSKNSTALRGFRWHPSLSRVVMNVVAAKLCCGI